MIRSSSWLRTLGRGILGLFLVFGLLIASAGIAHAQAEGEAKPAATEEKKEDMNIILFIIVKVKYFWLMLLPLSLWLVALMVLLILDLRGSSSIPPGFVDEFTDIVNKRKFKEAFEMAKNDPSFLGRVLTAGMGRLQYGLEDAREASINTLETIKSDKDQKNNYTAVIATLGPLLGLVGTVFGMIDSFKVLALGGNIVPAKLAEGISHALTVTLVGVAISVPAIAVNTFFRNRITQISMDVSHVADDLLTQMYHNSKKPAGTPSTAGSVPTVPGQPAR